jgi:hypothetical protein
MKILFRDLEKGKSFLFNGAYAIKVDDKRILISRFGADGFIELDEMEVFEISEDENDV